jgi:hypothetical protein
MIHNQFKSNRFLMILVKMHLLARIQFTRIIIDLKLESILRDCSENRSIFNDYSDLDYNRF